MPSTTKIICDYPGCGRELAPRSMPAHKAKHSRDDAKRAKESAPVDDPIRGEESPQASPAAGGGGPYAEPTDTGEKPPKARKGIKARLLGGGTAGERKPVLRSARRESAAGVISLAYGGTGMLLERSGADVPVGRTMQLLAEAAGDVGDDMLAGSAFDRIVLQRLTGKKVKDARRLGAIAGLPVIIGLIERNPAMATALQPVVRSMLEEFFIAMVPVVRKQKAQQAKYREAIAELFADDPEAAEKDPIAEMWNHIFAPPEDSPAEPDPPAGPPAGNGAPATPAPASAG